MVANMTPERRRYALVRVQRLNFKLTVLAKCPRNDEIVRSIASSKQALKRWKKELDHATA